MNRQERAIELRIISSHLDSVMHDLISYENRLLCAGCKAESKRLETVIEKLAYLSSGLGAKSNCLKRKENSKP